VGVATWGGGRKNDFQKKGGQGSDWGQETRRNKVPWKSLEGVSATTHFRNRRTLKGGPQGRIWKKRGERGAGKVECGHNSRKNKEVRKERGGLTCAVL